MRKPGIAQGDPPFTIHFRPLYSRTCVLRPGLGPRRDGAPYYFARKGLKISWPRTFKPRLSNVDGTGFLTERSRSKEVTWVYVETNASEDRCPDSLSRPS